MLNTHSLLYINSNAFSFYIIYSILYNLYKTHCQNKTTCYNLLVHKLKGIFSKFRAHAGRKKTVLNKHKNQEMLTNNTTNNMRLVPCGMTNKGYKGYKYVQ